MMDWTAMLPRVFVSADETTRKSLQRQRDEQRAKQRVPFTVAPGVVLDVVRDAAVTKLRAGEELRATDLVCGQVAGVVAWRLEERGLVLSLDEDDQRRLETRADARYVVAPSGAISCKRGIVPSGVEVTPADFARGQADLDDLVRRGAVTDRTPNPQPPPKRAA